MCSFTLQMAEYVSIMGTGDEGFNKDRDMTRILDHEVFAVPGRT